MDAHEVKIVREKDHTIFKRVMVEYEAVYEYCDRADEYLETGEMISQNDLAMKNAYRIAMKLLTAQQISDIRKKYQITQNDLAKLLGWGEKTITRYESHQVQDMAHDTILRKIDADPEWFLAILEERRNCFPEMAYLKYHNAALQVFEGDRDKYLRKSILAQYAKYCHAELCNGGMNVNLDKVVDVIRYYANSGRVISLYKVKLMQLLWFADFLSYKRRQSSMMGLVYTALPMGAVPIAHRSIINLKGISYEEIEYEDKTGYRFIGDQNGSYPFLSDEDKHLLDIVIEVCGSDTKDQIVKRMHRERAYQETKLNDIISYQFAQDLFIDEVP
ncbi:MAG: DUF4065 domain-containing protein [Lachnospiraceae bacterium]|nr:DUF4065 domain-containing protein [Lachnospiraceae bacterium]